MTIRSSSSVAEPIAADSNLELTNEQPHVFPAGTRTGDWLALGDVEQVAESTPPAPLDFADLSKETTGRRVLVRLVGCVAIAGILLGLVSLAMHAPARRAILHWGLFGRSETIGAQATR